MRICSRISALISSSSAMSIFFPSRLTTSLCFSSCLIAFVATGTSISNQNVEPIPGVDLTCKLLPIREIIFFERGNPNPVPRICFTSQISSRSKGSKIFSIILRCIPTPESLTVKRITFVFSEPVSFVELVISPTESVIIPCDLLNFIAFEIRFESTSFKSRLSPIMVSKSFIAFCTLSVRFLFFASIK